MSDIYIEIGDGIKSMGFTVSLDYGTDTGATWFAVSDCGKWKFSGSGHREEDIKEEIWEHMTEVAIERDAAKEWTRERY